MTLNSKKKGYVYEYRMVKWLKEIGYGAARRASKTVDDMGVDIEGTGPFLFQCKRMEKYPRFDQVLDHMTFDKRLINVVLYRRNRTEDIAVLFKDDFEKIITFIKEREPEFINHLNS